MLIWKLKFNPPKSQLHRINNPETPLTDPCPPENIWVEEPTAGNCSVVWEEVPLVDYYIAFIKRDDGTEKSCNTTETRCQFFCMCGYTYLTTVFPYNLAGSSPYSHVRNYTTSMSQSTYTNNRRFIQTRRPVLFSSSFLFFSLSPSSLLSRGCCYKSSVNRDPGDHVVTGQRGRTL